jgi:hypothetical protein
MHGRAADGAGSQDIALAGGALAASQSKDISCE